MEKVVWTKELVEMMILKYQEHEHLYNVSHCHYADRVKRSNTMFAICKELKEISPNISEDCIKKKLHTLRSQFIKEIREIANSKRSGVGTDDVYEPKLWCFSQLEFLKSQCTSRKSETNIPQIDTQDNMEESICQSSGDTNPKKRRKITHVKHKTDTLKDILLKRLDDQQKFDWLGKQVVCELNSIRNKRIQRDTAWKIQLLLREAVIEDENSAESLVEESPTCSSYASQRQTPTYSREASTSSSQSPDILELSLQGLLDDDDF